MSYLCAPETKGDSGAGAVTDFSREESWVGIVLDSISSSLVKGEGPHYLPAVDTDDEVKPRLNWYVFVLVAQNLKAEGAGAVRIAGRRVGIQAGDEAVEGAKHCKEVVKVVVGYEEVEESLVCIYVCNVPC